MSPEDMLPDPDSCSADVAAYALGALEAQEAAAFERHLRECAVCPVELAAFRQVVDDLAAAAPRIAAPRSLRRAVMAEVGATGRTAARPRPRLGLGVAGGAFAAGLAFAVVAVVVVVIALPGKMANRTIQADVAGTGSASLRISGGHAEMLVRDFAPPPAGEIYEVWLQRANHAPSPTMVLFSVDRAGDASVDVPGSLYGVSRVMVTPEPAGGSSHPTNPAVITVPVDG